MSIFRKIKTIFKSKKELLPEDVITNFEESLINADASFSVIKKIITKDLSKLESAEEVKEKISSSMLSILKPKERKIALTEENIPFVIFVCGVNGGGKTTTIGKLANKLSSEGRKVLIGACDTFRAAAVNQLEHWAEKAGVEIEKPLKENEDPSAVCYRAFKKAREENFDILIIDTSGRVQTNRALMEELRKMHTVLKKIDETKPDLTLFVLDGSIGQTAISQIKEFSEFVQIDGVCITKLDSSFKGGVLLSIANELESGIYFVGVGEEIEDISEFNAEEFVENIFEEII